GQHQRVAAFAAHSLRWSKAFPHLVGNSSLQVVGPPLGSSVSDVLPRRPLGISSKSRLALPIFTTRNFPSSVSPSPTMKICSPSLRKARRAVPFGIVP